MKKNISIIALVAVMFIYCALAQYFNYWSLLAAPAIAIIGLTLGINIQALSDLEQTSKEKQMEKTYKKRRIVTAIIAVILLIASFVGAYKAVTYIHNVLIAPTFTCKAGQVTLDNRHHNIYSVAEEMCDGNLSDASDWIIRSNKITDLGNLYVGQTITVLEKGNK